MARSIRWTSLALGLALLNLACTTEVPTTPHKPASVGGAAMKSLTIEGPNAIEPGPLVEGLPQQGPARQFRAIAHPVKGEPSDITATARWRVNNLDSPSLLAVLWPAGQPGLFRGFRAGEALITVDYGGLTVTKTVLVITPGTYRLSGVVRAAEDHTPLRSVWLRVTSGINTGLRVVTDTAGRFTLYGVAGPTTIVADLWPRQPETIDLDITSDVKRDVMLAIVPAELDVSGNWTYTLSASPSCRDRLPVEVRERQYDITMVQNGAEVSAVFFATNLRGGSRPGQFETSGLVRGRNLGLTIPGDTDEGGWSSVYFIDPVTPTISLGLSIHSDGGAIGSEFSLPTQGDIEVWLAPRPPNSVPDAICRATDHTVTLRRR